MMRIVSVTIPYPRPDRPYSGLFVRSRLEAMARHEELTVISPRPWFPVVRPAAPGGGGDGEFPDVRRPRMFYIPGALKAWDGRWLERCLRREIGRLGPGGPIRLIDAHFEYPEAVGAVRAARALGLPVFVTLRGLLTKYLGSASRREQCLRALREATGIISVAHVLKRTAEAHGIDGSKIRVIPNAVDAATFSAGPQAEARDGLEIGPDGPLIVTVGHLQPIKGQDELVRALAIVKARRGPVRLVLIGDDLYDLDYTRLVQGRIAAEGLSAEVSLIGQQSPARIASWLRAADLFVLPSHHEGCCNAVLEALACGTPVVATSVGDNPMYVDAARGRLVDVGDVPDLARAIDEALDRPWDRPAIASAVASRGWDHVARETLDFFRERLEAAPMGVAGCPPSSQEGRGVPEGSFRDAFGFMRRAHPIRPRAR